MSEYIEREAAMAAACKALCHPGVLCPDFKCAEVRDAFNAIPAADVVPVVRGRWIRHYEQADTGEDIITYPCGWVCSECGRWESEDEPFCNCGAMMEEEGE